MHRDQTTTRSIFEAFLIAAFLTVAVSLSAPPASAAWVGSIITERPAGQASANGFVATDGFIVLVRGDRFTYRGTGSAAITRILPGGSIAERTCYAQVSVELGIGNFRGNHNVIVSNQGHFGGPGPDCFLSIDSNPVGTEIIVELVGNFTIICDHAGCTGGSQNGKLIFKLTVE